MRLLLDQGLPRSTVLHLSNAGIEAIHVGERGLAKASDSRILDIGRQEEMVVVTLDAGALRSYRTIRNSHPNRRPSSTRFRTPAGGGVEGV